MSTGSDSKVDTKLFKATADSIGTVAKELESSFQEYGKVVQSLRSNWHGDTSDNIKNTADALQNSAAILIRALGGYRTVLNEIAGIYDNTEKDVQEKSKTLKFDKGMR